MRCAIPVALLALTACASPADHWKALYAQQRAKQMEIDKRTMARCHDRSIDNLLEASRETPTYEQMMARWTDLNDRDLVFGASIGDPAFCGGH